MVKKSNKKSFTKKSLDGIKNIYDNEMSNIRKPEKKRRGYVLLVVVLAIIFGLVAGFVGGGVALVTRKINIPLAGEYDIDSMLPKREITIETTRDVTIMEENRIGEVIEDMDKKIVDIYQQVESDDVLEQVVVENEVIARGVVLSGDGWIVTLESDKIDPEKISYIDEEIEVLEDEEPETLHDYQILTSDSKTHQITKILRDPQSDLVFLKTDGDDLPAAKIASKEDLNVGETVLAFDFEEYLKAEVSQLNYQPEPEEGNVIVKNADSFSDYVTLTQNLPGITKGAPLVDLTGAVVGLAVDQNTIMPTIYTRNLLTQVLGQGNDLENNAYLRRPYLGADYIDLHKYRGIYDERFNDLDSGALVYGNPAQGSPAYVAGIRNADVIVQVNGENVNGRRNLSELIWQYGPESTLEMKVINAGEEKTFQVVLGEIEVE